MRGFTKAAALLSSALTSAFVVPERASSSAGPGVEASDPVVQYYASKAHLSFNLDALEPQRSHIGETQNFTLEVGEVQDPRKPCGQSNLRFLGRALRSTWDGVTANGQQVFPETTPPIWATWQIHCLLSNNRPKDSERDYNEDPVHVLSLAIHRTTSEEDVGFTVSYGQLHQPHILQFETRSMDALAIESQIDHWRTPAGSFRSVEAKEPQEGFIYNTNDTQQTFEAKVHSMTQYVLDTFKAVKSKASTALKSCHRQVKAFKAKVHQAMAKLCPEQRKQKHLVDPSTKLTSITSSSVGASPDRLSYAPTPASTRSIHATIAPNYHSDNLDEVPKTVNLPTPTDPSASSTFSPHHHASSPASPFHFIKLLFIALTLFSLLTWVIIRLRDPRRRADRAARREERRNKKLYRRAAWEHWWQTRVCALRHRHCPRSRGTGTSDTWDEKRARVLQQESILEAVCQDDIRTLQFTTRPRRTGPNSIAAAEEGRNTFVYDSDSEAGSGRRLRSTSGRSVSTLPGYESEATQPPGYITEDISPDSSIVSTSPRISRDGGLGSEDGLWAKDMERLDLGPGVVGKG